MPKKKLQSVLAKVNQGPAEQRGTQKQKKPCFGICVALTLPRPFSLRSHSKQVRETKERLETALALPHTLCRVPCSLAQAGSVGRRRRL